MRSTREPGHFRARYEAAAGGARSAYPGSPTRLRYSTRAARPGARLCPHLICRPEVASRRPGGQEASRSRCGPRDPQPCPDAIALPATKRYPAGRQQQQRHRQGSNERTMSNWPPVLLPAARREATRSREMRVDKERSGLRGLLYTLLLRGGFFFIQCTQRLFVERIATEPAEGKEGPGQEPPDQGQQQELTHHGTSSVLSGAAARAAYPSC